MDAIHGTGNSSAIHDRSSSKCGLGQNVDYHINHRLEQFIVSSVSFVSSSFILDKKCLLKKVLSFFTLFILIGVIDRVSQLLHSHCSQPNIDDRSVVVCCNNYKVIERQKTQSNAKERKKQPVDKIH